MRQGQQLDSTPNEQWRGLSESVDRTGCRKHLVKKKDFARDDLSDSSNRTPKRFGYASFLYKIVARTRNTCSAKSNVTPDSHYRYICTQHTYIIYIEPIYISPQIKIEHDTKGLVASSCIIQHQSVSQIINYIKHQETEGGWRVDQSGCTPSPATEVPPRLCPPIPGAGAAPLASPASPLSATTSFSTGAPSSHAPTR